MEPIVTPADCALAVALPLTRREFEADVDAPGMDFARSVVAGSGRSLRAAWDQVYVPKVVHVCERVASSVHAAGSTVVTGVTAATLRALLQRFPVVCLLAHSVLPPVTPADVLLPREVLDRIEAGDSIVTRLLRSRIEPRAQQPDDEVGLRRQVAALLDAALEETRAWLASTVRVEPRAGAAPHVDRVMLEDCFGDALRRAHVIELRDGLQSMSELVAAVPEDFAGVLDLCVCNSVAFGASIKRRRPDCLVVQNTYLARVDLRLARYALAMELLKLAPARYTDVLLQLSLHFSRR